VNEIRAKLLEIACCELGNTAPAEYWLKVQGNNPGKKYAWCGVFYLWCLRQVELCDWQWTGLYFSRKLSATKDPQPGDLAYFDQPFQHHAMVQSVDGDLLALIQGNYGSPGRVAESVCSIVTKHPIFYSIEPLVAAALEKANVS
jgi:hypothetical protein